MLGDNKKTDMLEFGLLMGWLLVSAWILRAALLLAPFARAVLCSLSSCYKTQLRGTRAIILGQADTIRGFNYDCPSPKQSLKYRFSNKYIKKRCHALNNCLHIALVLQSHLSKCPEGHPLCFQTYLEGFFSFLFFFFLLAFQPDGYQRWCVSPQRKHHQGSH